MGVSPRKELVFDARRQAWVDMPSPEPDLYHGMMTAFVEGDAEGKISAEVRGWYETGDEARPFRSFRVTMNRRTGDSPWTFWYDRPAFDLDVAGMRVVERVVRKAIDAAPSLWAWLK